MAKRYYLIGQYHLYVQPVLVAVDDDGVTPPDELLVDALDKVNAGEGVNVLDPEYIEVTEQYGQPYESLSEGLQEALTNSRLVDHNGGILMAIRDWRELPEAEADELLTDVGVEDGSP